MKVFIFFRKHNDLDHGLPIVHYLVKNKGKNVELYGVKDSYKSCTKHINFLHKELGLSIRSFEDEFNTKLNNLTLEKVLQIKSFLKKLPRNFFGIVASIFAHNIARFLEFLSSRPAKIFVDKLESDSVVLVDYGTESMYPFRYILKFCKIKGVRIIAYQHGYLTMTNIDPIMQQKKTFLPEKFNNFIQPYLFAKYHREYYDKYLVGCCQKNTLFKGNLYKDFDKRKLPLVKEIGIPRFCIEWENIFIKSEVSNCMDQYKKHFDLNNGGVDSVNVILFLHSEKFGLDQELLYITIMELLKIKRVNLVIKPHPCSGIPSLLQGKLHHNNVSNCNSTDIIDWADVGIVFGTSIGFQMLQQDVTLLVPKYLDPNSTIYEENNVCVKFESVEEITDFVSNYPIVNNMPDKLTISNFLNKYIYNNMTYNEVMDEYCYFVDDKR